MKTSSPIASWCSSPEVLGLSEQAVHVWRVPLDVPVETVEQALALLSPEEREQAGRLRTEELRGRFIVRRARLRQILAQYLGTAPAAIRFQRGPYGKPSLAAPWSGARIEFSASHSADVALVAVGLARAVGIDIERIRAIPDFEAICRNYFASSEIEALGHSPEAERLAAFFRVWARKEAILKALGTGLSLALDQVEVSAAAEPASVVAIRGDRGLAAHWRLEDLHPAPGFAAALARYSGPREGTDSRLSTELFEFPP
jgi:4'-phosphopantetheinyl transferase